MNYYRSAGLAALFTALGVFGTITATAQPTPVINRPPPFVQAALPPPPPEASIVKVVLPGGHGSGVNIGKGYIVTAAHVVDTATTVHIKTASGIEAEAEVLWSNKTYDIALLRTNDAIGPGSAVDCRTALAGELIEGTGNPMDLEFIQTHGRIAGGIRETGPWKEALITDMTTVMGQSGSGVFQPDGRVIGIIVGVMSAPMKSKDAAGNDMQTRSITNFGMIVPSSTVCRLMAKGV